MDLRALSGPADQRRGVPERQFRDVPGPGVSVGERTDHSHAGAGMTAEGRYSRNEGLFGAEGQAKIAATKVTMVGFGGLGSHVAQQLAYLGVRMFALIDFDIVTGSSISRLIGAFDADVSAATKKINAAKRTIHNTSSAASVDRFDGRVADSGAEARMAWSTSSSDAWTATSTGSSSPKSAPGTTRFASTWPVTPEAARASGMAEGSSCALAAGAWCA